MPTVIVENRHRRRLSREAKDLFKEYCQSAEIHSELNVTYKDVASRVFGWLNKQPIDIWNEVIKILEIEILSSKDKCFTGKLSRLVSVLDGFHPGVRVNISSSDQISNRVLSILEKGKNNEDENDVIITKVLRELREFNLTEKEINEWLDSVRDTLD
jgi:hypothetical protein